MKINRRRWLISLFLALFFSLAWLILTTDHGMSALEFLRRKCYGEWTLDERVKRYAPEVDQRFQPIFQTLNLPYPPTEVAYIAFKDTQHLEVYARAKSQVWHHIKTYPILALSGKPGPKLKEGDRQVPEGMYRAAFLNPNSRFHLSIRLNYPNEFDQQMAHIDNRTQLGGDIMIHGNAVSIGCLAVGNRAAEDLFILASHVSKEHVYILISPTDFRQPNAPSITALTSQSEQPHWLGGLYAQLQKQLLQFPLPIHKTLTLTKSVNMS